MAAGHSHPHLPSTMQAVICHGPQDYRLEEWSVPEPGPGEVVIKVGSVGICASDLKCYLGAPLFWGDAHRTGYCQPPVIPGHEFVGDVVALGEGAGEKYGLAIGDRAVSEQIVPCWKCRYCRSGQYWMCQVHDIYGFRQRTFGAMAEYMLFPAGALNYKVPDRHPDASTPPSSSRSPARSMRSSAATSSSRTSSSIAGAGPLGLGMVAAARMKSPRLLVASTSTTGGWRPPRPAAPTSASIPAQGRCRRRGHRSSPTAMAATSISRRPAIPPRSKRGFA